MIYGYYRRSQPAGLGPQDTDSCEQKSGRTTSISWLVWCSFMCRRYLRRIALQNIRVASAVSTPGDSLDYIHATYGQFYM